MQYLDDDKTKEFAKLVAKKDAVGLEEFNNRNPFYKDIYSNLKGRAYFDEHSHFSFVVSPSKKTAAFICLLNEQDPMPRACGFNLEMHVIKADKDGKFHSTDRIRYDYYDDMIFEELRDDAIILKCTDRPKEKIRRKLKELPREMRMSEEELAEALANEEKARKIKEARTRHYQQKLTPTSQPTNRRLSQPATWNNVYIEL